jgi:hypothetical protein
LIDNNEPPEDDIDGVFGNEEGTQLPGVQDTTGNALVNLGTFLPFLKEILSCKSCAERGLLSEVQIFSETYFLDTRLTFLCLTCERLKEGSGCEKGVTRQSAKVTGEIKKRAGSPIKTRKEDSNFNSAVTSAVNQQFVVRVCKIIIYQLGARHVPRRAKA